MALVGFVNVDPRHSANHSIGRDFARLLKRLDGALGFGPEDTVNGPGINVIAGHGQLIGITLETGSEREQRDGAPGSTKKPFGQFQIPPNWHDTTLEQSGTKYAIIGNPFSRPKN